MKYTPVKASRGTKLSCKSWHQEAALRMLNNNLGGTLTVSSNTVAPTQNIHHVGAGLIKTITVPATITQGASVSFIPDDATTYDDSDNIYKPAGGGTLVVGKTWVVTWDGSKWYPSY